MDIFFTADTHFGHANINTYSNRPFQSAEEMDDALIAEINKTVDKGDVLYHLGDFALAGNQQLFQKNKNYRDRINCRAMFLIWGNHDRPNIRKLFASVWDAKLIKIGEQAIWLSHYAHATWHKAHHGALHLYGHSHGEAEDWLDRIMPGRRSMDVGVDNAAKLLGAYRPFSAKEVIDRLASRSGCSFDHHVYTPEGDDT